MTRSDFSTTDDDTTRPTGARPLRGADVAPARARGVDVPRAAADAGGVDQRGLRSELPDAWLACGEGGWKESRDGVGVRNRFGKPVRVHSPKVRRKSDGTEAHEMGRLEVVKVDFGPRCTANRPIRHLDLL